MIKFYDITEDALLNKEYEKEALYCCNDTGNMYYDSPAEGARKLLSSNLIKLNTETDRSNILAPIPGKIYCVIATGCMYIYENSKWNRLGSRQYIINNVVLEGTSPTIVEDSRITDIDTAEFIPDLSVADLLTACTVTCSNGKASIAFTASYPITGTLKIG